MIGNIGIGFKKILSFDSAALQDMLQKFIEDEDTTEQFMRVMDILVIDLQKKMEAPETQEFILSKVKDWVDVASEYLKTNIAKIIHQINVTNLVQEQVMKLDTDELEKMILDNTGGNLVMIQFLGGVLGLIAGFIQVHIYFAVPVLGLVVLTWISYSRNQKRYNLS